MIHDHRMRDLITIDAIRSAASRRSPSHHTLRQHLIVLVRKIAQFNLNEVNPSLTPIELLSRHMLLTLHQADHPLTSSELIEELHVSATAVEAALDRLRADQTIIPYTPTTSSQIPAVEITLEGRVRAHALTSGTDLLIRFVAHASPDALLDLQHSLLACLTRRRHAIPIEAMCVTCTHFVPFHYPDDPVQPHHCLLVNHPLLETSLRTTCPEHQISSRS